MPTLNTTAEVIAYLERHLGPCRPALPPMMTEAEYAEAEEAYANAPPLAEWTDVDVDDFFSGRDDEFGDDCDPTSPDGF